MPRHRPLPALTLAAALVLTGCGGDDDATPTAAAGTAVPTVSAAASAAPSPSVLSSKAQPKSGATSPTVAPEIVVPTYTDVRSEAALTGWQVAVVARLRQLDPRLVADRPATIRKVRATCEQMATGMFETKVFPIIVKRFSTTKIAVSEDLASAIYAALLQDACYVLDSA